MKPMTSLLVAARSSRHIPSRLCQQHSLWVAPSRLSQTQTRLLQTTSPLAAYPKNRKFQALPQDGPPRDNDIKARLVRVVNEDGKLNEPVFLHEALAPVDREKECLVQMVAETEDSPAVVKVFSKDELVEKYDRKKKGGGGSSWKQLELNWGIEAHDLQHRLKKIEEFIELGKSVELILMPKKKKKPATREQAFWLVKEVKLGIKQMKGKEIKPMEGALLGELRIFAKKKNAAEVAEQLRQEEEERERERLEQERLEREAAEAAARGETLEGADAAEGQQQVQEGEAQRVEAQVQESEQSAVKP
ncbi:hypothetical protein KEM55_002062 [Ascosphaera atra]|nr:hypothetical protein KEM55_002062 [Ascosphaera atra]